MGVHPAVWKHERILRGVALRTTNNRMELEAAINGLLVLTESCSVTVITDSRYLQQAMTVYLGVCRREKQFCPQMFQNDGLSVNLEA